MRGTPSRRRPHCTLAGVPALDKVPSEGDPGKGPRQRVCETRELDGSVAMFPFCLLHLTSAVCRR